MTEDFAYDTAVAIIGMSGRFPGAKTTAELWHNLINGVKGIRSFSDEELLAAGVDPELLRDPNYVKAGTVIDNVDSFDAPFFGYTPREAELMDPQLRLFLECMWEAMEAAAYDPERCAEIVGVFAGSANSTYMVNNILTNPEMVELAGLLQIGIGNMPDAFASTVSYKLNLRGPSVAVQTFCSTSLVAVHFACQSLLNYECDMALAGGVAITVPHGTGYLYQEGGILSPDGECRTFDARGQGSVMSNGVGVVVLKRLDQAIEDGDHIYAVIRGSAVNNDGQMRVGYTAPGLDGQTEVIAEAIAHAGVDPETISYVEAHGTATSLGDSIELAATIRAFQRSTDKKQFCAIGSVKPNVGHLDRASGITGLIKTSLALKHRQIPPSLNFERTNPDIDLANSPFFVNTTLREWTTNGTPRRAGLSSFGIGGTNVHLVLQEAPEIAPSDPARPYQLLILSTKTASALDAATANLGTYLEQNSDINLADVAYTLQVGRSAFNHRRFVVCRDLEDAVAALSAPESKQLSTAHQTYRDRPVAFLFPGVGDHYAGMAQELYASQPTFRTAVDRCCRILQPLLDKDLRALLYPDERPTINDQRPTSSDAGSLDLRALLGRGGQGGQEVGPLQQTALAQPAVFVVEYALAQLLMQWGVRPAALLGYSLGEYVAACLAGVLSLEDALHLVARRAQLIQALPAGAMLAVGLAETAVQPYLGEGIELAVINSPSTCVLAGPLDAIAALERRLAADEVACRRVETSHAFHTSMLAPAVEELTRLARGVTLHPPQIPYLSNVTGTWITEEQATDPAYWAQHMCQTVRFAEGVGALLAAEEQLLLEVGPGAALGSFVRQHPACSRKRMGLVLATLLGAQERGSDRAAMLTALGKLWQAGVTIDWTGVHSDERRQRVALPTYPFERQRHWVEPGGGIKLAGTLGASAGRKAHIADWFYAPVWQSRPLETPAPDAPATWLLFMDERGLGAALAARLSQDGHSVVQVRAGEAFAPLAAEEFTLRPDQPADYQALATALRDSGRFPSRVVHLWSVDPPAASVGPDTFRASQARGFYSLLYLAQALGQQLIDERIELVVVTDGMQAVAEGEVAAAEQATLLGLCKVIAQEQLTITCRSVDVRLAADASLDTVAGQLQTESGAGSRDVVVAYRGAARWAQQYTPLPLERAADTSRLRTGGVYLITGGLGGVGLVLADYLARTVQARLVLLGRSGLPSRETWGDLLATSPETDVTCQRIRKVQALEAQGAEVLVLGADVADAAQMQAVIAQTVARFGALHGVLHAAGISDPQTFGGIQGLGPQQCEQHFHPKAHGLYALETALDAHELDFCLVFSSISALLGGLGFGGYAAANSFMDAFVQRHNRTHPVAWVAVNWDTWHLKEDQWSTSIGATVAQFEMLPAEGAEAFERAILVRDHDQIVNSTGDLDARIRQWVQLESLRAAASAASSDLAPSTTGPRLSGSQALTSGEYERRIVAIWQQVLGIAQVGLHDNFFDLGGNSLIGLQVIAKLKKEFNTQVPAVALFEAPTVSALAQYLMPEPEPVADQQEARLADRRQRARQVVEHQDIAIIAMVGRFPGAENVEQFWQNLCDGVESISFFTDEELRTSGIDPQLLENPSYVKARPVLSDVEHFDAAFFGYTPREVEFLDPQQRLFQECAWQALEQAGYDTQRYKGLVGVFGGTNMNLYLIRLLNDPAMLERFSDMTFLENDKDALTTNVSYKLNLRGPSFAVQTYCSTSLVATHLACRSLRGGECDMALAGGVSVRLPVKSGYIYQEGDQCSIDGHVRTFDAQATGANFGDGVAIVVLKRLADAIEDGDTIHAVIKGSAINNDGGLKVGYTAPSVVGQADVVIAAHQDAGISADTISYVEAHGTATKLGDPIEVASLTRAFRTTTDKTGYCILSSVKPNVGHLDRAAGATALIKTTMALKHGLIPPHLHFQTPNPEIDFASSPFYVPVQATPWKRNGAPRRAGINSLGVGGTNAHVVVEEAPPIPPPSPARPYHLLLLSARTPTALEAATDNLHDYLRAQPDAPLPEVAYTLQVGRRVFDQRRLLVVRDRAEALDVLERRDPRRLISQVQKSTSRAVAFLFPGVGDHYVGMAEELYASEPTFHAAIDRCCRILEPLLDKDLRALLYPDDRRPTTDDRPTSSDAGSLNLRALLGRGGQGSQEVGPLQQTALAQPAVFVVEYALAHLLQQWGVRPAALLGYSLGEYVAACLAGVLSLDDALRLVALRARLIQNLPAGAMLAVGLSEAQVQPYLGDGVELAVINSPSTCVLAGPLDAIAALERRLAADEIACRRVETSHAFHTSMLAPVVEELTALARTVTLHPPQIPYLSNVTGTWITEEQATDPAYWAQHMCQTVRFAEGVGTLLAAEEQLLLEVGPGAALGSFVRQHPACARERMGLVLATLPGAQERTSDRAAVLTTLGKLWLLDVPIDWDGFYAGERRLRISLPTYPFERQRFWVEPRALLLTPAAPSVAGRKPDIADWFYLPAWEPAPLPTAVPAGQEPWLVFVEQDGFGALLADRLERSGRAVYRVQPGTEFAQLNDQCFSARPDAREDYVAVLRALAERGALPAAIAHLWNATAAAGLTADPASFRAGQARGYYSLQALVQALNAYDLDAPFQIAVFSDSVQPITDADRPCAEQAPILGACKVISQESLSLKFRSIDICAPEPNSVPEQDLLDLLLVELAARPADLTVAYRDGQRLVQRFRPERLAPVDGVPSRLRQHGVYLITGGLGGIGLILADYLARTVQARLVLLGRGGLPARETWDDWLATNDESDSTSQRIRKVQALEAQGAEVLVCSADVADAARMRAVLAETIERFGALHGVIHGAGYLVPEGFRPMQEMPYAQSENHFHAKIYGLYVLEELLEGHDLDFCVLLSSVSSVLGGLSYGAYTAANFFMDIFTHRHNRAGGVRWTAVNWDTWHTKAGQHDVIGATVAQYELYPAEGTDAFGRVLESGHTQVINSTGDLDARYRQWVLLESLSGEGAGSESALSGHARPALETAYVPPSGEYERRIAAIWEQVLGVDQVGIHDNFFDLGGNSLISLQVIAKLKKEFKTQIPAVALFEAPTVSTLAKYLMPDQPVAVEDPQETRLSDRRQRARQVTEHQDIAIIAMAGRFPGAENVEQFWQNLRDGVESLSTFSDEEMIAAGVDPRQVQHPDYVNARPVLSDIEHFDAAFFGYTPREAEVMDPQQRLFHECAWEAIEQAGYDTQRYKGLVGVYAGSNLSTYLIRLFSDPDIRAQATDMTFLENTNDGLPTSVAYRLNLRGPSFAVQTFCSTSLVATHLACRSLRGGECDMAIAGGISLRVPMKSGYIYQEGDQVSIDGHVRTFDSQATGANFGDGVAIVVLKRLADALEDGDTIHAVIKGTSINNDGSLKVGYTAPSVVGQADVVVAALQDAGLSADTISYVEAHGTATKLGDPIEVASLTKAFRTMTPKTGFCALSSVKTNVGHLDRAAGVTGLIKTVMALKHDLIPPHLHFQAPNPEIDFASSPFYVPVQATEWRRNGTPRRAGINSLGVGGTNAHVVVEEAPPIPPPSPARPYHLLLLSARTPTALEAVTDQLLAYLRDQPDAPLPEVAYTLQVGRRVFDQRRLLVVRDRTEALEVLERRDPRRLISQVQKPTSRAVAFLFPGVGDHYVGMAEELYASEPTFHAAIDRCCRILQPLLDKDLRALLYPEDGAATNGQRPTSTDAGSLDLRALLGRNGHGGPSGAGPLQQTALAQPAVFVVEYALAQLLMQWGVRPTALLGYSLGEYVAACLAGVLSLEDALRMVARRAQLIQALPAGAMLTVMLSEAEVQPYLGDGIELAVINSPSTCVLAGPPAAIAALEQRLAADEIACRRVETSHAFHTSMLAPVVEELTALARTVALHPPQIPYLSNVTGTWITAEQATDPAYWAQHMCQTVRFAEGVGALLAAEGQVLLEVGPGAALGSFVRQHPACARERMGLVLATLPGAQERTSDRAAALTTLGKLWLLDVPIAWEGFYAGERRLRIPLPTYPFERQRYWLDPKPQRGDTADPYSLVRRPDIADWFTVTSWKRTGPANAVAPERLLAEQQCWVVFVDACGVGAQLVEWLAAHNQDVVSVTPWSSFFKQGAGSYSIRPDVRADYDALFEDLRSQGKQPHRVVHLWMVTTPIDGADETETNLAGILEHGFYSLLALTQALGDQELESCRLDVISNDVQEVTSAERLCPAKATVIGPCKVIPQEYPNIRSRGIDIVLPADGGVPLVTLVQQLAGEMTAAFDDELVALRGAHRWVQIHEPIKVPQDAGAPRLREGGVYLITGGLGGIGLAIAEYLADTVRARLVLLGRSALPPREQWAQVLAAQGSEEGVGRRIHAVQALEARGAEVLLLQADVADPAQVQAAVTQALARFGTINGVLHAAGVPGVGLMQLKTAEAAAGVLAPKVQGTLALAAALRQVPLDFLMLFSSVATATSGGPGQVDYCAANAFMDAYAHKHCYEYGKTVAISWGEWLWDAWSAGLQGFSEAVREFFIATRRTFGITFEEGTEVLRRVLSSNLSHVYVTPQDLLTMIRLSRNPAGVGMFERGADGEDRPLYPRPALGSAYIAPRNELETQIAEVWTQVLGIAEIGIDDNFFELGGNSLLGIDLFTRIRKKLKLEKLPSHVLYEAPSVSALAEYIGQTQQEIESDEDLEDRGERRMEQLDYIQRRAEMEDFE